MKNPLLLKPRRQTTTILVALIVGFVSACNPPDDITIITLKPSSTKLPSTNTSTVTSKPSSTSTFTLQPSETLALADTSIPRVTPTSICLHVLNPPDGIEYPVLGEMKFEWESVEGAVKYRLDINSPDKTVLSYETFLTRMNRYLIMYPWGGRYTWSLSALDSHGGAICVVGPYGFTKIAYAPTQEPAASGKEQFYSSDQNCG